MRSVAVTIAMWIVWASTKHVRVWQYVGSQNAKFNSASKNNDFPTKLQDIIPANITRHTIYKWKTNVAIR